MPKDTVAKRPTRPVLRLVENTPDAEIMELARTIVQGDTEILGLAVVIVFEGGRYVTPVVGYCKTHPSHARGMLATLDDKLRELVAGRDPADVR